MRVFIDYDQNPLDGGIQILRDDISGRELSMDELINRILVDTYEDKYGRLILVFTDHTFEDQIK